MPKHAASLLAAVASLTVTMPTFAQPLRGDHTAAALMTVEHEWLSALQRHDVTALARILGREFIDSDFQGDAITRARYLAYFAHPVPRTAPHVQQSFADTKVRFVAGGNVAIVTGIVITRPEATPASGTSAGAAAGRHSRFTDVFVWREGRWQAVTGQETHFTPPRG